MSLCVLVICKTVSRRPPRCTLKKLNGETRTHENRATSARLEANFLTDLEAGEEWLLALFQQIIADNNVGVAWAVF
uniref:Transposase n=1 Tax=Steinernema glaseri TaxID=37863 RepID=A0A1I7YID0_9BILA